MKHKSGKSTGLVPQVRLDGRLTVTELAERVRLSVSPCHRRLRALERSGAISGYRAHLDADALGLTFEALVFVTMRAADRDTVDAFEEAVSAIPHICRPNGSSATPTTSCASSPATCPPSSRSTTSGSPPCPASNASPPPSS